MSPPPEEMLRAARTRSTPNARYSATPEPTRSDGFTGEVISNTLASKRKRPVASSASSSRTTLAAIDEDHPGGFNPPPSVENTPNPKARKQPKRSVTFAVPSSQDSTPQAPTTPTKSKKRGSVSPSKRSLTRSPRETNPKADYQSPSGGRRRRRSATPVIPPYEPPTDEFTPPREILYTPVQIPPKSPRTGSRRKSTATKKKLVLQIKQELPEVDLNAPIPPPSPSDDPLLLRGPTGTLRKRTRAKQNNKQTNARDTSSAQSSSPVREVHPLDNHSFDASVDMTMDSIPDDIQQPGPIFDFTAGGDDDDWTSESDKEFDQVGEYTGKFKVLTVPTKNDPPSSTTKQRQDAWGRPISPFPKVRRKSPTLEEDEDEEMVELTSSGVAEQETNIFAPEQPTSNPQSHPMSSVNDDVFVQSSSSGVIDSVRKSRSPVSDLYTTAAISVSVERMERLSGSPPRRPSGDHGALNVASASHSALPSKAPDPRFRFQDLDLPPSDDDNDDDDDMYADHIVPIHETSVGSIEVKAIDQPEDAVPDTSVDVYIDERVVEPIPQRSPSPPVPISKQQLPPVEPPVHDRHSASPRRVSEPSSNQPQEEPPTSISPRAARVDVASSSRLSPSPAAPDTSYEPGRPRSPGENMDLDDSEDDEEDEVSVVRELSQPPDMDSEDEATGRDNRLANSFAQVHLRSSPNPFHIRSDSPEIPRQQTPRPSRVQAAKDRLMASMEYSSTGNGPVQLSLADDVGDGDDGGSEELEVEPNVIKITSNDPLAAARAAAILRLHRYNHIDEATLRKRRHSNPAVDSILRNARRKTTLEAGITKSVPHKRRTLGKVIGDKVFIPGSPAMTLPELLDQAEASLQVEEMTLGHSPLRNVSFLDDFKTPVKQIIRSNVSSVQTSPDVLAGPRDWTKNDWRLLDACYTDERLALGDCSGLAVDELAPADDVDLGNVVGRFIEIIGGEEALASLGSSWTSDNLLKRARALRRKQRSGNIAPPTPSRDSSVVSNDSHLRRYMSPHLASSVSSDATACHQELNGQNTSQGIAYQKLMDEALTVMNGEVPLDGSQRDSDHASQKVPPTSEPEPASIASKVKGFLFSYLPRATKPKPAQHTSVTQKGLPIPPPEVFQRPRPPISTPAPKAAHKPTHPKNLVHLHPAPPPKPSMIPRPAKHVRRLVDLHHISPPEPKPKPKPTDPVIRERRDSGASVRDLVKTFEDISRQEIEERETLSRLGHRRVETWANSRAAPQKPTWKP
ncbi:unnamed protein product [Somion occarium]